jgi:hypothetical protein
MRFHFLSLAFLAAALTSAAACAQAPACRAQSPAHRATVIELYTSEGCSSCPPADRWLSGLKSAAAEGQVVAQAFHVSYWDSIGWVDRFAAPVHNARQREIAARQHSRTVYTPQLVKDGRDSRDFGAAVPARRETAAAVIRLEKTSSDTVSADVTPTRPGAAWSAYWTVTEHGHASKVSAGENSGEFLKHDFVVRQYVAAGSYQGSHKLTLTTVPATAGHPRQVNLVVFDPANGQPLQALSLQCSG